MSIHAKSASAGTGKTYSLTKELSDSIEAKEVRPEAVVATTFTVKAAQELQERVRLKLLETGQIFEAQCLAASRMGTVNSVCDQFVRQYAFRLGLSPELEILEDGDAATLLRTVIAEVASDAELRELTSLSGRLVKFDWEKNVKAVLTKMRLNRLTPEDLRSQAQRSWESYQNVLDAAFDSAENYYNQLEQEFANFESYLDGKAKVAKPVVALRKSLAKIVRTRDVDSMPGWDVWAKASRPKKLSKDDGSAYESLGLLLDQFTRHPQLHADANRAIELVFDLAARAFDAFQSMKQQLGVLDFTDQETYALKLLEEPAVIEELTGTIDLLLIDEFQDTSPLQLAVFVKLAQCAKKTIFVGDPKQAIYRFRDCDSGLMMRCLDLMLDGKEPDTLNESWRSRKPLVELASDIFVPAFERCGLSEEKVRITPHRDDEDPSMGNPVEFWPLTGSNDAKRQAQFLACIKSLLDSDYSVVDRETGELRKLQASDIGVLCRFNKTASVIAQELETVGLRAIVPKGGLLATAEGTLLLAGLKLWVDPRDGVARAELSRVIDADQHVSEQGLSGWMDELIASKNAEHYEDHPILGPFIQAASSSSAKIVGPLLAFDRVLSLLNVFEICHRWGNTAIRLANVDRMRSHLVEYGKMTKGTGSIMGFVAHLTDLSNQQEASYFSKDAPTLDKQALYSEGNAISVMTWHKSKGLEFPVTILYEIEKFKPDSALGIHLETENANFTLENPLEGRWIRYWPTLIKEISRADALPLAHYEAIAASQEQQLAQERSRAENLRLFYVGFTRAREQVVLVAPSLNAGLLGELRDKDDNLLIYPSSDMKEISSADSLLRKGTAQWAGKTIELVQRHHTDPELESLEVKAEAIYERTPQKEYGVASRAPSSISDPGEALAPIVLGKRKPMKLGTSISVQVLGNCVHAFFAADRPTYSAQRRNKIATRLKQSWGLDGVFDNADVLTASEELVDWVNENWPQAQWLREYPIHYVDKLGTLVRGDIDLLLKTDEGFVIVDHKTFPGKLGDAQAKAASYAGQLEAYGVAVEAATGEKVLSSWIHFPVLGATIEVRPTEKTE